jgi:hypothetical protein
MQVRLVDKANGYVPSGEGAGNEILPGDLPLEGSSEGRGGQGDAEGFRVLDPAAITAATTTGRRAAGVEAAWRAGSSTREGVGAGAVGIAMAGLGVQEHGLGEGVGLPGILEEEVGD